MAQAIDQLETYAAIITILIIRWYAGSIESPPEMAMAEVQVMHMGFFSFTSDALLSIAAIINILVINSVKFFCEVMVWLTPFPFVDALLEAGNKALCAGLIAIYAYSPMIATVLELDSVRGVLDRVPLDQSTSNLVKKRVGRSDLGSF